MTAPTLTRASSTPLNSDINVSTETNIVLVFDQAVDVESGNVVLYKDSDDSVVETIAVTSGQVTGTGTTTITINPSVVLEGNTKYYLLIDSTAFDNSGSESYAGITDKTEFSFRTAIVPKTIQEQIKSLEPSAVIELFQLHLYKDVNNADVTTMVDNGAIELDSNTSVFYYHAGTNELYADIKFGTHSDGTEVTYSAVPCEIDGFKRTTTGTLPRPTFTIANANSAMSALLQLTNSEEKTINILGAKVQRIRTCKKFLNASNFTGGSNATADPTAVFETDDSWYIDRIASENLNAISFELATKLDLTNVRLPKRQIMEYCPFKYKGEACGYTGTKYFDIDDNSVTTEAEDVCGHRHESCKKRFGSVDSYGQLIVFADKPLPFGGFPGARLQM